MLDDMANAADDKKGFLLPLKPGEKKSPSKVHTIML